MTAAVYDDGIPFGLAPPEPDSSWTPIKLTSLPDKPPIQPTLGSSGLIYPGKRHVFTGPPESAKTLAAYAILIQVVREPDHTGILIDFEMGAYDARQRLRELGATDHELDRIDYLEPDEPATPDRISRLVDLNPAIVVIDAALGAYSLQGLDDSNRGDVEKLSRLYVSSFWRAGIATIVIDHVVKDAEQRGRYAIGSERKLGGADVSLGFETITAISRGTSGRYKIVTHKDRGGYLKRGHVADLNLASDAATHVITTSFTTPDTPAPTDAGFRFDVKMEQVSKKLEQLSEPVSGNDLYTIIGGNKQAFLSAVEDLITHEYARRISGPKSPIEFVKPFRRNQVVPGGSNVVPEPGTGALVPGSPPYGEEPVPGTVQETIPLSGWFQDDGTFNASELSYLESIAPTDDNDA